MSNQKVEIIVKLHDDNNQETLVSSTIKEVPNFGDVDKSNFLASLDTLETTVLEVSKKVSTDIVEHIVGAGSKKKVDEATVLSSSNRLIVTESAYPVEAKFGTIVIPMYRLKDGRRTVYCSTTDYFPELASRQSLCTPKYLQIAMWTCSHDSFRVAAEGLTMWRGEGNAIINPMTLRNQIESQGAKIAAEVSQMAEEALSEAGFFGNGVPRIPEIELFDPQPLPGMASEIDLSSRLLSSVTERLQLLEFKPPLLPDRGSVSWRSPQISPRMAPKMVIPEPFDLPLLPGLESKIERPPRLLPSLMAKMLLQPFDLPLLPGLESEIERPPRLLPSLMARMQLPWQCVLESRLKLPDLLSCAMDPVKVKAVAQKFKITNFNVNDFEDPTKVTNASVDEIGVTAQNPKRPMPKGMTKKAYTETTVIHVQNEIGNYILSGDGIANTLKSMRGYLALNNLLYDPIVFFSDGARSIHNEIESMFSFTSYKVILDWFHLKKKFQEFFSMAFKGKDIRNAQLNIVMPMLWYGNVAAAIAFMEKADDSIVKSRTRLDELIGYLNRNRPNIPNYALRKKLGLRNSSNLGEKANDLVIATRQKNHGASFSDHGSLGLGAVCCTCLNNELESWVKTNTISFTPIPKLAKAA